MNTDRIKALQLLTVLIKEAAVSMSKTPGKNGVTLPQEFVIDRAFTCLDILGVTAQEFAYAMMTNPYLKPHPEDADKLPDLIPIIFGEKGKSN